ncbi:hypothetical protein Aperf_G00000125451 [Anoplocephala perfoliata]
MHCPQRNKGAYVYANLPLVGTPCGRSNVDPCKPITLLRAKAGTYPRLKPLTPGIPVCDGHFAEKKRKRFVKSRNILKNSFEGDTDLADFIGPCSLIYSHSLKTADLKSRLEELEQPVEKDDFWSQTDEFLARAPTPPFIPEKIGLDVATQIEPWELFDFNVEVKSILEVLIGKTVEQSLLEVAEEEELWELRKQQQIKMETYNAELAEVERLEERNQRYREEQNRRKAQAAIAAWMRRRTADKIAARSFTKTYLQPLLPSVYEQLTQRGFLYDEVEHEVIEGFLDPLVDDVMGRHNLERLARLLIDDVIKEAVIQRHTNYRELGREMMTVALIRQSVPATFIRIGDELLDELIELILHLMRIGTRAQREIRAIVVWSVFESALDATTERIFRDYEEESNE